MMDKVIALEKRKGASQLLLKRVMRMVPEKDRGDENLLRLLAFRLEIDGEAATIEYLMKKIREVIQCSYTGKLYDFLKNDKHTRQCLPVERLPDPPEIA